MTPALWSAIAAGGSALCAFLTYLIHRRNLLEAARPELVLEGWERAAATSPGPDAVITIRSVRNVGRGISLHGIVTVDQKGAKRPLAIWAEQPLILPLVAPGESQDLNAKLRVRWGDVPPAGPGLPRIAAAVVRLFAFDARAVRHEIMYEILVWENDEIVVGAARLAPGVLLQRRWTRARAQWRLRLGKRLRVAWGRFSDLTWRRLVQAGQARANRLPSSGDELG